MDNSNACLYMRMCVLLRWPSMRCPARVAYADVPFDRVAMDLFFQINKFANASAHLYFLAGVNNGNACRIISPILKTFKAVQKNFFCLVISYVADYAAHN